MSSRTRLAQASGLLAALIAISSLLSLVPPVRASGENSLTFGPDREPTARFGANDVIRIDGTLTYKDDCAKEAISDWVYAASDVYIVKAGSVAAGAKLEDAGGGRANTIVARASLFTEEIIGVTPPTGKIGAGVYDVVYDTCQDGTFTPGEDALFPGVITVTLPTVLPPASEAIYLMKGDAFVEYLSWMATRFALKKIFELADKAIGIQCEIGNAVGCAMKKLDYFDGVKEKFFALMLNEANHYLAIALDPPDPDFDRVTKVSPFEVPAARSDSAVSTATGETLLPLAAEAAVSEALLHAVERYQGAAAAGDAGWALEHAREASRLAALLADVQEAATGELEALRAALATEPGLDDAIEAGRAFGGDIWHYGFGPNERRAMLNQGRSATEIAGLESELRTAYSEGGVTLPQALARLDEQLAARAGTSAAAMAASAAWTDVVAAIEADPAIVPAGPGADAGGPYAAGEGATLTLHGTAGGPVDAVRWDLDADGAFDDASGLEPAVSFPSAGVRLVGLRVEDGDRVSVAYGIVNVGDTARAPVITDPQPAVRAATVTVGGSEAFSVAASDPDGDPVTFAWTLDGEPVTGSGATFAYAPTAAEVGVHEVAVRASDGTPGGGETRRSWDVVVLAPDADGDGWTQTTDCDDDIASVHPTATELFGNGLDDDCDAATPDAPPGGLTGTMWSWGSNHNGSVGTGSFSPVVVPAPVEIPGHDDIVQVDSSSRGGWALTADGVVLGWGFNGSGELGNNTYATSATPTSPLAVDGGPGPLAGVTQVSGHSQVAARRTDGTVVSWGSNLAGQAGNGTIGGNQLYPVVVRTSPGGPPLAGVRAVETGYSETYALMDDGTVRVWGQVRCDGGTNIRQEPYPVELDLVGAGVRQVASGNQWTMFLKDDGTILSCGAVSPVAGRPVPNLASAYEPQPIPGFGPDSPAVDIAAGVEVGLALKADGTVWTWGRNNNGELFAIGAASGASVPLPVQVQLPPGAPVVDVDMDNACHAIVLRADGSVLTWGCDYFGQAGDGTTDTDGIVEQFTTIELPGRSAVSVTNSVWNSLVLTRPADDPAWERPATWVATAAEDTTVGESAGGSFEVGISASLPHDVTIDWSLAAGSAGPDDLDLASGTVTIPAGSTSATVAVPVHDDAIDEDDETFTIVLTGASNGIGLARSQANGTITDDDATPAVSVEPATVTEGDTAIADAAVRVTLSRPAAVPVSVSYATADGSAAAPGDYAAASGTLVVPAGETEAVLHLSVRGDTTPEPEEQLTVTLSGPVGATLGDASATVTIRDDDPLVLVVASPRVSEGDAGTTPATFTVALEPSVPAGTTVTVDWAVEALSADVPADVAASGGSLVFEPGDGPKSLTVDVAGDEEPETAEVFRLALANPVASDGRRVVEGDNPPAVIVDDDAPAAPSTPPEVDAGADVTGVEGSAITLDATASDPDEGDALTYAWTYQAGGDVDAGATCSFEDAAAADTTVTCTDDGTYTATLEVSDGQGHTVSDAVSVTVSNADPDVVITAPSDLSGILTGNPVNLAATLGDPGANDPVGCSIDWGDGTIEDGTLESGSCTGSHAYAAPGVPTVRVTATDDDAGTARDAIILVVTTPQSRVTGGGWIGGGDGRTRFGLVVEPAGDAYDGELQVIGGGHRFHAHEVAGLVAESPTATWSGTGRWDGEDGYTYLASVEDLRNGGGRKGTPDTFSIEVRDASGAVVFTASGPLEGGNVKVR